MTRLSRGSLARARRGFAAAATIAALLMVWVFPGNAQTYPDRPIRVIVPIAAGSVTDVIMRATANELKAYAQAHPRALNYGTLGPGSNPEMFLKWMNQKWNVDIVGIPYRGGGPIAQALVAGELQIAKMGLGNFLGLLGTGKIKPLAVAAVRRSPLAPDVPTLAEAGIDFPPFGWWGLAAPKGVPQPIVDRLNAEFVKLYREPKFTDYLEKQAVLPAPGTPAEFAAFLKRDRQDAELLINIANQPREDYKAE